MSEDFKKFEEERVELAKKHSKKDKKGEVKTITNKGVQEFDIESQEKFDKDFEALKKTHKTAIDNREKQIKEYKELVETEAETEVYKIKLSDVPSDISVAQMEIIKELISDE